MRKIRVAVLYGGRSGEHEVSLRSAAAVVRNLDPERFEVIPIGIDKQGHWLLNDVKDVLLEKESALRIHASVPTGQTEKKELSCFASLTTKNGEHDLFDVVFPVIHGVLCEDGTMQGMLELIDVPYVGANVLASALGMDKDVSKRLVAAAGLPVAQYKVINQGSWQHDPQRYLTSINDNLPYPLFVKPVNTGSSVGVHKVKRPEELVAAIDDAFLYDTKVMIEQGLNVREIEVSVLENSHYGEPPLVSIPGEIAPRHEFYSYAAKYLDPNGADLMIPADLNQEQVQQAQQMAAQVFDILGCEGMARVDLFLDKDTGQFVFNEINTIPGFTQISMYPKLWQASGISYRQLLSCLIDLALARHKRRQALKRNWALPA